MGILQSPKMPARLIVNADDFGLTPGINQAIAELHTAGVLTSATLMANGPAFADAARIARTLPTLGVGAHIVLTDGTPISDPSTIPTLLGSDRRTLRPTLTAFLAALLTGRIHEDDIYREALAQIQKLQAAGINPTHLDTHKHTHIFPQVLRAILRAARGTGIPALRYPFEPRWSATLCAAATPNPRRLEVRALGLLEPRFRATLADHPTLHTPDATLGIAATGTLTASTLNAILQFLPATAPGTEEPATYELCCHPGYNTPDLDPIPTRLRTHRNVEREALLTVIPKFLARPNATQLIHYGDL